MKGKQMAEIKAENYITVQGWMVSDLKLKGNELLIYAIIYGFSQDGETRFTGSLGYLAAWTNSTKQGVIKNLKALVEKGFIIKTDKIINGVKFCEYHSTELNRVLNKVEQGIKQSLTGGIQQSLNNNIVSDKQDNNIEDIKGKKERNTQTSYDAILSNVQNDSLRECYIEYIKMRKLIKSPMTDRALKMLINRVNELEPYNVENQKRLLETAIMNNWKSVYPLKDTAPQQRRTSGGNVFMEIAEDEGIF